MLGFVYCFDLGLEISPFIIRRTILRTHPLLFEAFDDLRIWYQLKQIFPPLLPLETVLIQQNNVSERSDQLFNCLSGIRDLALPTVHPAEIPLLNRWW